jgi:hypothetical protein
LLESSGLFAFKHAVDINFPEGFISEPLLNIFVGGIMIA